MHKIIVFDRLSPKNIDSFMRISTVAGLDKKGLIRGLEGVKWELGLPKSSSRNGVFCTGNGTYILGSLGTNLVLL